MSSLPSRDGGRSTRRLAVAVLLGLVAAGILTGCSVAGNEANSWLASKPIVESTELRLTGCEALCDPRVEGTIADDATEGDVRALVQDATAYLADSTAAGLRISLNYHNVTLSVGTDAQQAEQDADLVFTVLNDDRVESAGLGWDVPLVYTAPATMTAVFRDYGTQAPVAVMATESDEHGDFMLVTDDGRPCASTDLLLAAFDMLITDPAVAGVDLSECTSLAVTIDDLTSREPMLAHLQPLAADPALTGITVEILQDYQAKIVVTGGAVVPTP